MTSNDATEVYENPDAAMTDLNNRKAKFSKLNIKRSEREILGTIFREYSICMRDYEFASGLSLNEFDIQEKIYDHLIVIERVLHRRSRTIGVSK